MTKTITILGGMGPQASLLLHERIIKHATEGKFMTNADFPEIRHFSIAVPDFISDPTKRSAALVIFREHLRHFYLWRQRSYCYSL